MEKISVVLPAHNEEANITPVVEDALQTLSKIGLLYEIIVVDDGSRDLTPQIVDELAQTYPEIHPVHHSSNRGYGAALRSGFQAAKGDLIFFMDADRQFDIAELELFLPFADDFDVIAGYRIKRNDPVSRLIIGRSFNFLVRLLFGVKLKDIDCGFRLFRAEVLRDMRLVSPGALINTEIFAKAKRDGRRIKEIGVHHFPRVVGDQSGASVRVVSRAFLEILRLKWRLLTTKRDVSKIAIQESGRSG